MTAQWLVKQHRWSKVTKIRAENRKVFAINWLKCESFPRRDIEKLLENPHCWAAFWFRQPCWAVTLVAKGTKASFLPATILNFGPNSKKQNCWLLIKWGNGTFFINCSNVLMKIQKSTSFCNRCQMLFLSSIHFYGKLQHNQEQMEHDLILENATMNQKSLIPCTKIS